MSNKAKMRWRWVVMVLAAATVVGYGLHVAQNWNVLRPDSDVLATLLFFWASVTYTMAFSAIGGAQGVVRNVLRTILLFITLLIALGWFTSVQFEKSVVIGVFGTVSLALIIIGDYLAEEVPPSLGDKSNHDRILRRNGSKSTRLERGVALLLIALSTLRRR